MQSNAVAIVVRPYQDSDHDSVVALWRVAFPNDPPWNEPVEFIRRKRLTQPELFWVADSGGQILGTVVAGYDGVRGWIYHLAVDPSRRRQGTARLLMQTAEETLVALGCAKINLQIKSDNLGVVDFYKTLGYGIEERVQMGKPVGEHARRSIVADGH
jgi:ribosomal protein S18 acetylase RimI-like enzyme